MNNTTSLSSLIWSSADDVLLGLFKPGEYGRVILPFAVMRRLDCVLEPKKDEVYNLYEKYKRQVDPTPVILNQTGLKFFNRSRYDLSRLKSDPDNILMNFNNYVQGYSRNVLDIIENFSLNPLVEKLHKHNRLYLLIDKFTRVDLHPSVVDNHQMGSVYEELLRRFSEMSNEESGNHFTPRDVVKLLVSFVFGGNKADLQGEGKIRSVFDPCCGTGGMLTIGKEWVHQNINQDLVINLYGQELNDVTYSICKSDLLMMDENPEHIHGPCSSLSDDRLQGQKFDYMITNPPFGVSWKSEQSFVLEESKGQVQLINGTSFSTKMKKNLGDKGKYLSDEQIQTLSDIYQSNEEGEFCKIFPNEFFGYTKIVVDQPLIEDGETQTDKKGNPKPDTKKRDHERVPLDQNVDEYWQREVWPHLPDSWMDRSKDKIGYEINFTKYFYQFTPLRSVEEITADLRTLDEEISQLSLEIMR